MPPQLTSLGADAPLSVAAEHFLFYAEVELGYARQSLIKYRDCFRQITRMIGDRAVATYIKDDVLVLKSKMLAKGNSVSRQVSILAALKRLLEFLQDENHLPVLDSASVVIPKRPRREVLAFRDWLMAAAQ